MPRRVGVLGGTFDPVHVGHLDAAAATHAALALDRVLLVPSRQPPHRSASPQASPFHRFAMTALAVAAEPYLEASELELQSPAPSYTIDTLRRLHGAGLAARELFFITGADAFADIATWREYPRLLDHAHFVVVSRPGHPASAIRERLPEWSARVRDASRLVGDETPPSIVLVDGETRDVSSTLIRDACRDGRSISGLVPSLVEGHIRRHRLYGADAQAP